METYLKNLLIWIIICVARVTRKVMSWIRKPFLQIFEICWKKQGGCLLREQIFWNGFKELLTGNGIEGSLTFISSNTLIAIATTEWFRDSFCSCSSRSKGESLRKLNFFQSYRKNHIQHGRNHPKVFCKVASKTFFKFYSEIPMAQSFFNKVATWSSATQQKRDFKTIVFLRISEKN